MTQHTSLATAVVAGNHVPVESIGTSEFAITGHGLERKRPAGEKRANIRVKAQQNKGLGTKVFPSSDVVCLGIARDYIELTQSGTVQCVEGEEPDDVIARKWQSRSDVPLNGALVQLIVGCHHAAMLRLLQGATSMQKNIIDYIHQGQRHAFEEAPGREWK